jgi:hypothetical protein
MAHAGKERPKREALSPVSPEPDSEPPAKRARSAGRGEDGDWVVHCADGEVCVYERVLALASPVFNDMVATADAGTRRTVCPFPVADFEEFYKFIHPATARTSLLDPENVATIATIADFYKVTSLLTECIREAVRHEARAHLLPLVKKHCTEETYWRKIGCCASGLGPHDDTTLMAHPDILLDLLTRTRELNQAHKNLMDYRTDLGVNVMKQMRVTRDKLDAYIEKLPKGGGHYSVIEANGEIRRYIRILEKGFSNSTGPTRFFSAVDQYM